MYTYLLTPWSRVRLEKLTGFQLDKKGNIYVYMYMYMYMYIYIYYN